MTARWPMLCPHCNVGQPGHCDCPNGAAEAATDLGFEHEAPSAVTARLRARAAGVLAALGILALYTFAGEPPPEILGELYLPGDGFPVELLTAALDPAPKASEATP